MEIVHRSTANLGAGSAPPCRGAVLAIGNFDGVHRGHQQVLGVTTELARNAGAPAAAMVFEPHPRTFFQPDHTLLRLTRMDVKYSLMAALGLDCLVVMEFDRELAGLPADRFVTDVLVADLQIAHVVIGHDFRFGHRRAGDEALLRRLAGEHGFQVTAVEAFVSADDGEQISSTAIRRALEAGDPRRAGELLGYWWTLKGEVVAGDRRGRTIGFPTANIALDVRQQPRFGVYAVRARAADEPARAWTGVANLGRRPTFDKQDVLLEVHLLDVDVDLYGRDLLVEFVDFLRPERRFDGLDALKAQIAEDAAAARALFSGLARDGDPLSRFPLARRFAD